eukprot:800651_1
MADNDVQQMMEQEINAATEQPNNDENETKEQENNNENDNENTTQPTTLKPVTSVLNFEKPTTLQFNKQNDETPNPKLFNEDVRIRLWRWLFISAMPVIFLAILSAQAYNSSDGKFDSDNVELSFLIGLSVEIYYLAYFGLIGYLFWSGAQKSKGRYLFRVWTRSNPVPGWAKLNIASHQQLYEWEAIQSISEFSAIDGGVPSFMLANLGPYTWAIVTMHFAAELQCPIIAFEWDTADLCEVIGVCGLVMIGIFELDPYNPGMKKFHYLGAGMGVGTVVGFFIQAFSLSPAAAGHPDDVNYGLLVLSILISLIAGSCFMLWQWSNKSTVKYQEEIREKYKDRKPSEEETTIIKGTITRFSVKNVIFEGVFLWCGATCLAIWLMNYNHKCCARG